MATAIRMIRHEDHMSLVDHLDELRSRLIVSVLVFGVAFGLCFWQNHALLHIVNEPLEQQTRHQVARGEGPLGGIWKAQEGVRSISKTDQAVVQTLLKPSSGLHLSAYARAELAHQLSQMKKDVASLPRKPVGAHPTTLGFGEPFTTTLTVTFYIAILLSLPVILFELYGFVLPAFNQEERRVALPLLLAVPVLFGAGVAFGYYIVLPAAVHFFQNFNSSEFNVLVQGGSYYKFAVIVLVALGFVFQVPVAILAATSAGIVTPKQLRKGRRYAFLGCAIIAAFIPGEVVTMVLETIPLYVLFEISILLAVLVDRRRRRQRNAMEADLALAGVDGSSVPVPGEDLDSAVQEMLDHVDPDLHKRG